MNDSNILISSLKTIAHVHGYLACKESAALIEHLQSENAAKAKEISKLRSNYLLNQHNETKRKIAKTRQILKSQHGFAY